MTSNYLQYWKKESVLENDHGVFKHAASEQFKSIRKGDIVWIVTIDNSRLILYGRIEVDKITSQDEAEKILKTDNLWFSDFHIIAREGTECYPFLIDITDYAHELRFQSKADRLPKNYSGQNLQRIRLLSDESVSLLNLIWKELKDSNSSDFGAVLLRSNDFLPEEEILTHDLNEGHVTTVVVNRYERSSIARRKCIERHGTDCAVCGFSFLEKYGEIGRGFIHVHHIVPLSQIKNEHAIDPVRDLRPVCPNCHAMLHRYEPALSIEELKKKIAILQNSPKE